jgi:hypothetical protein
LSRAVPRRTSPFTLTPRSSRAFAMRPPRSPVAPATTMVEAFMIPILAKGQRRCRSGRPEPPVHECYATIPVQMPCQHTSDEDLEGCYLGKRPHSHAPDRR